MELRIAAFVLFPLLAAGLVWMAGRRDMARDPRLSTVLLALSASFPLLWLMPALPLVPVAGSGTAAVGGGLGSGPWLWVLVWVWALGFLFALGRMVAGLLGLRNWRLRSRFLGWADDPSLHIELRALPELRGPVAAGWLRKTIYVPEDWDEWDLEAREAVLAHELAHHRRHDPLRRWIGEAAAAVHWFNPLVRWMKRRLFLQCELACDRRVIDAGMPAKYYAELLFRIATIGAPVGACAMAGRSSLENRVRGLLRPVPQGGFLTVPLLLVIGVGTALLLGTAGRRTERTITTPPTEETETRMQAEPFPADR